MKVYVFGNEYEVGDKRAIEVAKELDDSVEGISFVFVRPNEDLPFVDERHVVILDTVQGIQAVTLLERHNRQVDLGPSRGSARLRSGLSAEVSEEAEQAGLGASSLACSSGARKSSWPPISSPSVGVWPMSVS